MSRGGSHPFVLARVALVKNATTSVGVALIPCRTIVIRGVVAPQLKFGIGLSGGARQTFLFGNPKNIEPGRAGRRPAFTLWVHVSVIAV